MKKYRAKKTGPPPHGHHHHDAHHEEICPDDPCLIMLRDTAIAQREAILFYLEAAAMVCDDDLRQLFLATAEDEMRLFVMTMRHISALDRVQAEALEAIGLDVLLMQRGMAPKWATGWHPDCACPLEDETMHPPMPPTPEEENDLTSVCLLTKALTSALEAVNMYHKYKEKTEDSACCRHFCHLMNAKKEHVASFIAALYDLTGEPPLEETD